MSTPLELAELLEEGPRRAGDAFIASELRRLAQVEAEHAALLKAIMDAEPVGFAPIAAVNWMMEVTSTNTVTTLFKNPPSARKTTPLYTLNGIKP